MSTDGQREEGEEEGGVQERKPGEIRPAMDSLPEDYGAENSDLEEYYHPLSDADWSFAAIASGYSNDLWTTAKIISDTDNLLRGAMCDAIIESLRLQHSEQSLRKGMEDWFTRNDFPMEATDAANMLRRFLVDDPTHMRIRISRVDHGSTWIIGAIVLSVIALDLVKSFAKGAAEESGKLLVQRVHSSWQGRVKKDVTKHNVVRRRRLAGPMGIYKDLAHLEVAFKRNDGQHEEETGSPPHEDYKTYDFTGQEITRRK